MAWKCPQCGNGDLDVSIQTWARLDQSDVDNITTDTDGAQFNDHEWDGDSLMQCRACGHCAKAETFVKQ